MSAKSEANNTITVCCPQCKTQAKWLETNPYRPFCSSRCRFIDLNGWTNDEYKIPDYSVSNETTYDSGEVENN